MGDKTPKTTTGDVASIAGRVLAGGPYAQDDVEALAGSVLAHHGEPLDPYTALIAAGAVDRDALRSDDKIRGQEVNTVWTDELASVHGELSLKKYTEAMERDMVRRQAHKFVEARVAKENEQRAYYDGVWTGVSLTAVVVLIVGVLIALAI